MSAVSPGVVHVISKSQSPTGNSWLGSSRTSVSDLCSRDAITSHELAVVSVLSVVYAPPPATILGVEETSS